MSMILTKDTISESVKKGIWYWTSTSSAYFYRDIKKACENKYNGANYDVDENHIKWFNGLESLFKNYQDNTTKYETIYRADIIENKKDENLSDDELFINFCNIYIKDKKIKFEDMLCSFSSCKKAANHASINNNKYHGLKTPQVMYVLKSRISKYLYIADFSQVSTEEEILYFGKNIFIVVEQKILPDNNVEIYIIETEVINPEL